MPTVDRVDTAIFARRYFMACMECTFCNDVCCRFGVDVDAETVTRILARAPELEAVVGIPRDQWFSDTWNIDPEVPGGKNTRTRVIDGTCAFRNRRGRGCLLHSHSLHAGLDYHELKPMISTLFPVTFDGGLLFPSEEARGKGDLVCLDQGETLYRGVRGELAYYFGQALVDDLDAIEGRPA